jgi:hypothetical protein
MSEIPEEELLVIEAAEVARWAGKLDRFCAELKSHGFRIQRDGLTVRILLPEEPAGPTDAEAGQWQGSDL